MPPTAMTADDCRHDTELGTTDKSLGFIKTATATASCMTLAASAMTAPLAAQHRQAVTIFTSQATLL